MKMTAGLGASACLALALAGCATKCGADVTDCPVAPPTAQQTAPLPATPPPAAVEPPADTPPAPTTNDAPKTPIDAAPEFAANADAAPAAPEADMPVTIVTTRDIEEPKTPAGEGTADWAVPLEDMPEYLESIGAPVPAPKAEDDKDLVAANPDVEGVGSTLGMEKEEDMTGALLVPGAVTIDLPDDGNQGVMTIDFPDEDVRPDSFGVVSEDVSGEADASAPADALVPMGEVLAGVVARADVQEAAATPDAFEAMTAIPDELAVSPEPDEDPGLTDLPSSLTADRAPALEEDEESFDDKFSVDNINLDFFDQLSDSLESEQK